MIAVAVDLGRSSCRVATYDDVTEPVRETHPIGAGLGDPGGVRSVAEAVRQVLSATPPTPWSLCVALPGASAAPHLAADLASTLARCWSTPPDEIVVVSDALAWHAGALGGEHGVVVAIGTGAVAVRVDSDGVRLADGRGILLGDDGSGGWIGLRALRAAARAHDGTGPATALLPAAIEQFGPRPGWADLIGHHRVAATLAEFAPVVIALSDTDEVAREVLRRATVALAQTVGAVAAVGDTAVMVGGLAEVAAIRDGVVALTPGVRWRPPRGDGCDGARLLLRDRDTVMEPSLTRVSAQPLASSASSVADEVDHLPTEARRAGSASLETLPTVDLVAILLDAQAEAQPAARAEAASIAQVAEQVAEALGNGGRLVYVGAGTPGRLAVQDAAELTPTFGLAAERTLTLLAGGAAAGARAVEGAEDDESAARAAVDVHAIDARDVVIGISASGRTPFVLAALERARELGAVTVGVSSIAGSDLSRDADVGIELPTGPEVLAGSTRMIAGTAQKIVLNTISTAALVRTGATYGPWMVDMLATNAKLRRRAVRIVCEVTAVSQEQATEALTAAGGSVKVALVSLLGGVDPERARALLDAAGSVRGALEEGTP